MNGMIITTDIYRNMIQYCLSQKPVEACGLISGSSRVAQQWWPIRNIDQSPVSFTMDQAEMEEAFEQMKQNGQELYAIFHSHPTGPPYPSPFDIEHFCYPCSCIIVSLAGIRPRLRSYKIMQGTAKQERMFVVRP